MKCIQVEMLLLFSHAVVWLFVTPWTAACQASLPFTIAWSSLKFMSTEITPRERVNLWHEHFSDHQITFVNWVTDIGSFLKQHTRLKTAMFQGGGKKSWVIYHHIMLSNKREPECCNDHIIVCTENKNKRVICKNCKGLTLFHFLFLLKHVLII